MVHRKKLVNVKSSTIFTYPVIKKTGNIRILISLTIVIFLSGCFLSDSPRIEIISYVVRDRVIPLDHIEMRSMVIVAFKILPKLKNLANLTVSGELYHNKSLISKDEISRLDAPGNNLGFDIPLSHSDFNYEKPFSIPEGRYLIVINLLDSHKRPIAQCKKELSRNQFARTFEGIDKNYEQPRYVFLNNIEENSRTSHQVTNLNDFKERDYLIFQKNMLVRVYPHTVPDAPDFIRELRLEISRNEYRSVSFCIRALKNLGKMKVEVTPLRGKKGILDADSIKVGTVGQLTEIVKTEKEKNIVYYRYAPKIIRSEEVSIPQHFTRTYWLTLKAGSKTMPGDYNGAIIIKPQFGQQTKIPIHVKVLPLRLTDTDIQYGMMMTYAFYELDNNGWTEKEKALIKQRGYEIYKNFKEHGMTMIYPHSYFYLKFNTDGQAVLDSLRASLEAYKKLGFPGPFCWYLGHLLQTAKTKHPGSILNYDTRIAQRRLHNLLNEFELMAKELGIPKDKLIVQLVDEPDPDQKERTQAGKELHKVAKALGFRTLITRPWTDVDVICTGIPDNEKEAERLRQVGKQWWIYPNGALDSKNLAYTRYVFGFGAWRMGVNGVAPWTFQMSQGSNGNPFTVLDGPEIMVAYPGVNGRPIPTPTWEAIRDGINDYKYIYQLEKLISAEKARENPAALRIERQLAQLKKNLGKSPGLKENDFGDWLPETFDKRRKQIVEWAMELP